MEQHEYTVEPFRPEDAEQVPRLFHEVYGDAYPVKTVYNPEEIIAASESGRYFPFVVRVPPGRVIAYGALYNSAPYGGIYEFGQGAVSADFRSAGIGRLLFEYVGRYAPTLPGSAMYFGEAVCNHTHTQKAGALIRTLETGIEVDLLPGENYARFGAVSGRVAVVDMFRTFVPRHHRVLLPGVYDEILRYIYDGFDDSRTIEIASDEVTSTEETRFNTQIYDTAGVARIAVAQAGADFEPAFDAETEAIANRRDIRVVQVWLNLSWPWISALTDALRKRGYFFGGLFPRWFDDDALMLQKVTGEPNWKDIHLYSARSEEILRFIRDDRASIRILTETGNGGAS